MTDFEELLVLYIINACKNFTGISAILESNKITIPLASKIIDIISAMTYPIALIIGIDSGNELTFLKMLFDDTVKAEQVVEFIKSCITTGKE